MPMFAASPLERGSYIYVTVEPGVRKVLAQVNNPVSREFGKAVRLGLLDMLVKGCPVSTPDMYFQRIN